MTASPDADEEYLREERRCIIWTSLLAENKDWSDDEAWAEAVKREGHQHAVSDHRDERSG